FLPAIAEGKLKIAFAHSEPGARYDLARVGSKAEPHAGGVRLTGQKSVVLGGDDADLFIVSANTAKGLSLFLIERNTAGLKVTPHINFDDTRAANITLSNVETGAAALLSAEGQALPLIVSAMDRAAAALSWDAVGAMTALNEVTLDYIKTRVQFGRP